MPSVVLILFVIAVLMLCYGVSVIMRSLAEWRFFRKYPYSAARRHGRWWSPIVGIAMIGVSVLPAWFGFRWQEDLGADDFGWPHAAGLGLLIFAAWMLIVWGIGERARGRRWCPRCRYDMEGIYGLRCPECGKEPKHEKALHRARRPKWAARIAVFSLVLAGYTMWVARPMVEQGPLMAVPTWVMMAGWEWLPESWITDRDGGLKSRLYWGDLSDERRFRFAVSVFDDLYSSEEHRWNPVAWELMLATDQNRELGNLPALEQNAVDPAKTRKEELFRMMFAELLAAVETHSADPNSITRIQRYSMIERHMLELIWRDDAAWNAAISHAVSDSWPVDFVPLFDDQQTRETAFILAAGSGNGFEVAIAFLDTMSQDSEDQNRFYDLVHIARLFESDHDHSVCEPVFERMQHWLRNSGPTRTMDAVRISMMMGDSSADGDLVECPHNAFLVEPLIALRSRIDRSDGVLDIEQGSGLSSLAWRRDPPELVFPAMRAALDDGVAFSSLRTYDHTDEDHYYGLWIEHFAALVSHQNPQIRVWLSESLPYERPNAHATELEDLLARLAADEDALVSGSAMDRLDAWNPDRAWELQNGS